MSQLLERLRAALSARYRVDSEIGEGGMARVFLGHDPALDRPVAIKVLRPERATARAAEAFLDEARTVARLAHPHIVPIHDVGSADGLFYYVMEYMAGESLRDRLERGPLPAAEALRLAGDVLEALEAVHGAGVLHRDVTPGNVFLQSGRAVLGDFGVAAAGEAGTGDAAAGTAAAGTPGYMAPERAAGEPGDRRSDLYAAGLVVYEMLTGRRFPPFQDPARADWSGVPPGAARALRRVLQRTPEERWPDARAFRDALLAPASVRARRGLAAGALAAAAFLVAGVWGVGWLLTDEGGGSGPPPYDVAVLPCEPIDPGDSALALQTSRVAASALEVVPRLRTPSHLRSFRWWALRGAEAEDPFAGALRALESRFVTHCTLQPREADSLTVELELVGRDGTTTPPVRVRAAADRAPVRLGSDLAVAIVRSLRPDAALSEQSLGSLAGRAGTAVRAFLLGEDAFQRDARCLAEAYYEAAVEADSSFTLARWRLADVRRYLSADEPVGELRWLAEHAGELAPVDRRMLAARLLPPGPERFAEYRRAVRDHPRDTYLLFTYGDELFHRGPLWGIAPDSALEVLRLTTARDSFLAPAWDHLVLALIRAGERESARDALVHLQAIKQGDAEPGCVLYAPALLAQAWGERFEPERAAGARAELFARGASSPDLLAPAARFAGPYLDLPRTQIELGRALRGSSEATARHRLAGTVAEALGLWSRGRVGEALAALDAAAALHRGPEGRLHAAEWRIVPHALGLEGVPSAEVEAGREALAALATDPDPEVGLRARFALGLLDGGALATGEAASAPDGAADSPAANEAKTRAATLHAAFRAARAGDPEGALRRSEPLLAWREIGHEPGPFFRSALYVLRGAWERQVGRSARADAAWMWHDAVDLAGAPTSFPQRGEVSWALGGWVDFRRAVLAAGRGDSAGTCRLAREALRHWEAPDASLDPLRRELRLLRDTRCVP